MMANIDFLYISLIGKKTENSISHHIILLKKKQLINNMALWLCPKFLSIFRLKTGNKKNFCTNKGYYTTVINNLIINSQFHS